MMLRFSEPSPLTPLKGELEDASARWVLAYAQLSRDCSYGVGNLSLALICFFETPLRVQKVEILTPLAVKV